jgi:hypothetical protein
MVTRRCVKKLRERGARPDYDRMVLSSTRVAATCRSEF